MSDPCSQNCLYICVHGIAASKFGGADIFEAEWIKSVHAPMFYDDTYIASTTDPLAMVRPVLLRTVGSDSGVEGPGKVPPPLFLVSAGRFCSQFPLTHGSSLFVSASPAMECCASSWAGSAGRRLIFVVTRWVAAKGPGACQGPSQDEPHSFEWRGSQGGPQGLHRAQCEVPGFQKPGHGHDRME